MSLRELTDTETELMNEGFVAAGRTIPFPIPESVSVVPLPPKDAELAKQGLLRTLIVSGDSLEGIGVYDGDKVLCRKVFDKKDIDPHDICIVYLPQTGELLAKRIRFNGKQVILQPCNNERQERRVEPSEVEIRGIVVGLIRTPDKHGRFDRGYDKGIPL